MYNIFNNAISFNKDINNWNVNNDIFMGWNMFTDSGLQNQSPDWYSD